MKVQEMKNKNKHCLTSLRSPRELLEVCYFLGRKGIQHLSKLKIAQKENDVLPILHLEKLTQQ